MKTRIVILLSIAVLFTITACSSAKSGTIYQPKWYGLQGNADYVYTYGQAEKRNENMAEKAAYADAMQEAAQYVESHVQGMIKNYMEEAGVDNPQTLALTSSVARVVSNAKFTGTIKSQREGLKTKEGYKYFIRVSIPKDEINRNMRNQIKNEEALYNQFKASQAFQELDNFLDKQ
ncbi:MAG: hypothetical protein WCX83_03715 [Candidatus Cloacimonas sp.]|nr:hypothetical protein [Candidatus Cloacimonadota bacterium]